LTVLQNLGKYSSYVLNSWYCLLGCSALAIVFKRILFFITFHTNFIWIFLTIIKHDFSGKSAIDYLTEKGLYCMIAQSHNNSIFNLQNFKNINFFLFFYGLLWWVIFKYIFLYKLNQLISFIYFLLLFLIKGSEFSIIEIGTNTSIC